MGARRARKASGSNGLDGINAAAVARDGPGGLLSAASHHVSTAAFPDADTLSPRGTCTRERENSSAAVLYAFSAKNFSANIIPRRSHLAICILPCRGTPPRGRAVAVHSSRASVSPCPVCEPSSSSVPPVASERLTAAAEGDIMLPTPFFFFAAVAGVSRLGAAALLMELCCLLPPAAAWPLGRVAPGVARGTSSYWLSRHG